MGDNKSLQVVRDNKGMTEINHRRWLWVQVLASFDAKVEDVIEMAGIGLIIRLSWSFSFV